MPHITVTIIATQFSVWVTVCYCLTRVTYKGRHMKMKTSPGRGSCSLRLCPRYDKWFALEKSCQFNL